MLEWLLTVSIVTTFATDPRIQPGQYWSNDFVCQTEAAASVWTNGYSSGGASICSTRPIFWNGDPYNVVQATGLNTKPTTDFDGQTLPPGKSFKPDQEVCNQQQHRFPGCHTATLSCPPPLVVLEAASEKYNRNYCGDPNHLPFNELPRAVAQETETALLKGYNLGGYQPNPGGHWFEVPLNYDDIEPIPNIGQLFTTRVPRNLEWSPTNQTDGVLNSDRLSFIANVDLHKVDIVVMLPITSNQANEAINVASKVYAGTQPNHTIDGLFGYNEISVLGANSEHLIEFYRSLNLTMLACPLNDFMPPNPIQLVRCVEAIVGWLIQGKNVVVHCFGGSGRTGLMVMSTAKLLGVPDVVVRARKYGKSVYLDVHEQELMVQQMPPLWSPFLERLDTTGQIGKVVKDRWAVQVLNAWKTEPSRVVLCPTGYIILNDVCQLMASCRSCMPSGDGNPGSWPLDGQHTLDMPNGYDRKPVIFQTSTPFPLPTPLLSPTTLYSPTTLLSPTPLLSPSPLLSSTVTFEAATDLPTQDLSSTNNYWYNAEPIAEMECEGGLCKLVNLDVWMEPSPSPVRK